MSMTVTVVTRIETMARWQPDARGRLRQAAFELYGEHGFDRTTVAQIADRAGLTRSTFFRHFPDKRDVLAAGQETLSALLAQGVREAPAGATPMQAVAAGLVSASAAMTPFNRELGPRLDRIARSINAIRGEVLG